MWIRSCSRFLLLQPLLSQLNKLRLPPHACSLLQPWIVLLQHGCVSEERIGTHQSSLTHESGHLATLSFEESASIRSNSHTHTHSLFPIAESREREE